MKEMEKVYNPRLIEKKWYDFWLEKGLFHAEINSEKIPYTIVIPPPNVTDILHMGHVLNNTLQDIMIRFKKLQGFETLWLPGSDHAGIATQNVVERNLEKQGRNRHELGREKTIELIWDWRKTKGGKIFDQLKRLGCSCDWRRERFTMDDGLSNAVKEAFVSLYEKGLIYRGKYITNWCPRCNTALSDDEVEHEEKASHLWYIKYPVKGRKNACITVATTRPETMLGDTAVAVNPKDERFANLVGEKLLLPLTNREIPIIADEFVDREFGTGCVKVTPAHDPNDFDMALRHELPKIIIMDENGIMNENAGAEYAGMDRFVCRDNVIKDLKARNLLEKIEDYDHSVGHCYRCDTVIEPYLSDQWFVKMKPLAKKAMKVVEDGKIVFHPNRYTKVYFNWLNNIRDWCISRQIWWGHRIPVYYCDDCGEVIVSKEEPKECPKCHSAHLHQDPDVLDTWFSSWLWPFSTLGWPERTKDLEYFYPTDLLITAYDILFFWVARMIMGGMEMMDEIPFKAVYLHGLVLDEKGIKMSKSLGNSPDPIDIMDKYGTDALRFSMVFNTPKGNDVLYFDSLVETGRNFANKIWNAARFSLTNAKEIHGLPEPTDEVIEIVDRWILHRLNEVKRDVSDAYEEFRFLDVTHQLYEFFWNEFCAWYLEIIKDRFYNSEDISSKHMAKYLMLKVLDESLIMLHPIMPFITEEIWQRIKDFYPYEKEYSIMRAAFPQPTEADSYPDEAAHMQLIFKIITAIRSIRKDMNVPLGEQVEIVIKDVETARCKILQDNRHYIKVMAKVEDMYIGDDTIKPEKSTTTVVDDIEIYMPLEGLIDLEKERERLLKKLSKVEISLKKCVGKLNNQNFIENAPETIIQQERERQEQLENTIEKIKANISFLD
ncbi:MAG TPA: valine--tRNA ligase [Candidatus Cloacimonetes bacterium]|nr:valine--tRNA ligase [Candidatus Cloacimonadota bacterium]HEX38296.1 valine--tRNA ligase [Candidatus Cloacimonadota bacterium]